MELLKAINDSVAYIEKHLCDDIKIGETARIACLSEDSYRRFFSYMTGMSVNEYIRCRRLTLAAEDISNTAASILDIALKFGYESSDSFSRAFTRQHGISPGNYRKIGGPLTVYPPASFVIHMKGASKMKLEWKTMESLHLRGISMAFNPDTMTREQLRHTIWAEDEENAAKRICLGEWNERGSQAFDGLWFGLWKDGRYMVGRLAADTTEPDLEEIILPEETYATFCSEPGGYAGDVIPKMFDEVVDSWLPSSGYTIAEDFFLEVYHLCTDQEERRKNRYYEIWIPVKKT
ncbi:MAG: AraC family transcriptional regulator [Clostridiales bacterium]|nr:AraC family transcriptional regulator [Clostridiales bacterium]